LVPVRIEGQDFEFLFDTGAAYTAVSKDLVALLDIPIVPQRRVAIAPAHGGVFYVPMTTIAELRIGGFFLTAVAAVVLEFPPPLKIDEVLGMNVLRQFRITLESDTATLVLRRPVSAS
jgi:predicted aspartyl protease